MSSTTHTQVVKYVVKYVREGYADYSYWWQLFHCVCVCVCVKSSHCTGSGILYLPGSGILIVRLMQMQDIQSGFQSWLCHLSIIWSYNLRNTHASGLSLWKTGVIIEFIFYGL